MRSFDLAPPPVTPHPIPPGAPLDAWPCDLRVAIQQTPGTPWTWDDASVWDELDPGAVWDGEATPPVWVDAVCDWSGMTIDHGPADELGVFPAAELVATLDNRAGTWSTWTPSGRLAAFPIGTPVAVWAVVDGDDRWLFSGRTTSWLQSGDVVTVTAFDGFADLAGDAGAPWTPGTANQRPLPRLQAIAAAARYPGPVAGDTGHVDLLAPTLNGDVGALEAMQVAALSDGGVLYGDVDGTIRYRDRYWRAGRADQTRTVVFTDNVCDAGVVVWDPVVGASDVAVADEVTLTNTDDVTVTATTGAPRPRRLTHPDPDWWPNAGVGATLAAWLLQAANGAGYRVEQFTLNVLTGDARQVGLVDAATDVRRGDRFAWTSDQATPTGPVRLDLTSIVAGFRHDLTPGSWQTVVYGTRAVAAYIAWLWDDAHPWDDTNPDNVWRP